MKAINALTLLIVAEISAFDHRSSKSCEILERKHSTTGTFRKSLVVASFVALLKLNAALTEVRVRPRVPSSSDSLAASSMLHGSDPSMVLTRNTATQGDWTWKFESAKNN